MLYADFRGKSENLPSVTGKVHVRIDANSSDDLGFPATGCCAPDEDGSGATGFDAVLPSIQGVEVLAN
jgi:hypothetical protein